MIHGILHWMSILSTCNKQFIFYKDVLATHSSVLAWRIPETEEPGGLPSMGSHSRTRLKWLSSSSIHSRNFPVAHTIKNLLAMQETRVWSLGQEDPLEKGMATHSSVLAWRIPGTGEPGELPSMGSHSRTRLKRLSSSSSSMWKKNGKKAIC